MVHRREEGVPRMEHGHAPDDLLAMLDELQEAQPWRARALCRNYDPELWFPGKGSSVLPAKKLCRKCPVLHECRVWGLTDPSASGVVGGLSENERRDIRMGRKSPDDLDPPTAA